MLLDTTLFSPRRIGRQTDLLGECPLWDDRAGCLYWIDIRQPTLRRFTPASGSVDSWPLPDVAGSIALVEDGRVLLAMTSRIGLFDPRDGSLESCGPAPHLPEGHRFNDGRCDPAGRFWVGTMNNATRAPEGTLYRLEGTGPMVPVHEGIHIPNSLAFSPDGRTMYFADSLRYAIHAHPFDPSSGDVGPPAVLRTYTPPAFPDGSAVDADGCLWNAEFNGGRLVRIAPDGRIERTIPLPVSRPTCCAFGGPGRETLFVTSASHGMSDAEHSAQPLAGALLALDIGIRGLPEHRFKLSPMETTI